MQHGQRLSRHNINWKPPIDDDNNWVYRDGYWWTEVELELQENWTDKDEAGLEEYEIRRRERIARENEY